MRRTAGDKPDQFVSQLERAFKARDDMGLKSNAMRLVNGHGDGIDGLLLDRFNRHFVGYLLDGKWLEHKKTIFETLKKHYDVDYMVFKDRSVSATRQASHLEMEVFLEGESSQTVVEENGLKFYVDLTDHLNQGLFLDMRKNRGLVAYHAKGRAILNCFAYTCSFGVYCRSAGAAHVVNVDISTKFLNRGRENYALNALPAGAAEFVREDAVRYLDKIAKRQLKFDAVILDPPSFARFGREIFSVKKEMPLLLEKAFRVLAPEGIIFAATNLSSLSIARLEEWAYVAAKANHRKIREISRLGQDIDFRGSGLMRESSLSAILLKT